METAASKIVWTKENVKRFELFLTCVNENKEEIVRRYRIQTSEHFGEHLKEPEKEELPRIVELDPDTFYGGAAAKDPRYQPTKIRGEEKKAEMKGNLVNMNQFFSSRQQSRKAIKAKSKLERGMRATLTGTAGSGKTTTLGRFAREATKGNIDQMKQDGFIVHQVNCRELDPEKEISVPQFLFRIMYCKQEMSEEDMDFAYRWMLENPSIIALIIDSLDTMRFQLEEVERVVGPDDIATPDVILHNLLTGNLFKKSFVLTSSREYKIKGYKGALRPDKVLSLVGLTTNSIKNLTHGFVGKEEGERIIKELDRCPGLKELCETPVFLIFTIIGFISKDDDSAFAPKSMTGILVNVINCLSRSKHARTRERLSEEEFFAAINKMKNLAYNGMMEDKVLYSKDDLIKANLTEEEISDMAMIIPGAVKKFQQILESGAVSFFIHQLLGELLCALKMCEKDLENFSQFASKDIHEGKYFVIRLLMCGVLLNDEVFKEASVLMLKGEQDFEEKKKILRESLKKQFLKLLGKNKQRRDFIELLHAIHESGDGGVGIVPPTIDEISIAYIPLTASDTFALGGSISHSSHLSKLKLSGCNLSLESVQALDNKLQHSNLTVTEVDVSVNLTMKAEGFSSLARLVGRHGVDKLGVRGCGLNTEKVACLDEGLGHAQLSLTELDVRSNTNMGVDGLYSLGRLVGRHGVKKLGVVVCKLKPEEMNSLDAGLGDAKVIELDVGGNKNMGVEGFFSLGRLVGKHEVDKLCMRDCELKPEEVNSFDAGLGDEKFQVAELDVECNKRMGVEGFFSLGRLVGRHGVHKLAVRECELKPEEVGSLDAGLGDAKVKEIDMRCQGYSLPTREICKLLPKITDCLELRQNDLGEEGESILQEELNRLYPTNLKVLVDGGPFWNGKMLQAEEKKPRMAPERPAEDDSSFPLLQSAQDISQYRGEIGLQYDVVSLSDGESREDVQETDDSKERLAKLKISAESTAGSAVDKIDLADEKNPTLVEKLRLEFKKECLITPNGGTIHLEEASLCVHQTSLFEPENIILSMSMDFRNLRIPIGQLPITPLVGIETAQYAQVRSTLKVPTWFQKQRSNVVFNVYKGVTRDGTITWYEYPTEVKMGDGFVEFEISHFCVFVVALNFIEWGFGKMSLSHALLYKGDNFRAFVCYRFPGYLYERNLEFLTKEGYIWLHHDSFAMSTAKETSVPVKIESHKPRHYHCEPIQRIITPDSFRWFKCTVPCLFLLKYPDENPKKISLSYKVGDVDAPLAIEPAADVPASNLVMGVDKLIVANTFVGEKATVNLTEIGTQKTAKI